MHRQGIDAGIEDADARLPDPFLSRMPDPHILFPGYRHLRIRLPLSQVLAGSTAAASRECQL